MKVHTSLEGYLHAMAMRDKLTPKTHASLLRHIRSCPTCLEAAKAKGLRV